MWALGSGSGPQAAAAARPAARAAASCSLGAYTGSQAPQSRAPTSVLGVLPARSKLHHRPHEAPYRRRREARLARPARGAALAADLLQSVVHGLRGGGAMVGRRGLRVGVAPLVSHTVRCDGSVAQG
jgi:hypothetical protein